MACAVRYIARGLPKLMLARLHCDQIRTTTMNAPDADAPLIDRVKRSTQDEATIEVAALEFLREHVPPKVSPMCGNSICQDRRFLARWMPTLEAYFHYRNLDVSTLKELARRWKPELMKGVPKEGRHEALADVYESIAELRYYRANFLRE